jgi:hypothetical protein
MMVRSAALERSRDTQAVCRMARTLLGANPAPETRGTVGLLIYDFLNAPATATVDELLQVRF